MTKNFKETLINAERYYQGIEHNFVAKIMSGLGFTSQIDTSERSYYVRTRVDEDAEIVIMEISPTIHCCKDARSAVSEYIHKINSKYKCGNIRISESGDLYIHTEQRFNDAPLSIEVFRIMETESMKILDTFEDILEKLSHFRLIDPEEADVEKVIKKRLENMKVSHLGRLFLEDDEDDADDSPMKFPEIPTFSEWLSSKKEENDDGEGIKVDELVESFREIAPGTTSLLDKLLSIHEDEGESDIDESTKNDVIDGENISS